VGEAGLGQRTALMLVHGSGNLRYASQAKVTIQVYDPQGRSLEKMVNIPAFGSQILWLDELFPDLSKFLFDGYGSCLITSRQADLNVQLLTTTEAGGVSLQHLWGY